MKKIKFLAMEGEVLGIRTYRGLGLLKDISKISKADVFDQKNNPTGTQRDLNIRHAREAYYYVNNAEKAFWPEVILCCRNSKVLSFKRTDATTGAGILEIDMEKIENSGSEIAISRLDGNHRLYYVSGEEDNFEAIARQASYCILMDLTREDEIKLFRDINNNQKRMNTSHLDNIEVRLTSQERIKREDVPLYIASKLGMDKESPFYGLVYEGGKKTKELHVPLRSLKSGITYLRQNSRRIEYLKDVDVEYMLIRNYWRAVKMWVPGAWEEPKKYLLLRGAGLWGVSYLGGFVVDHCLDTGIYKDKDILKTLKSGKEWNWTTSGDFKGYSGAGGAFEIAKKIKESLKISSSVSMREISDALRNDKR